MEDALWQLGGSAWLVNLGRKKPEAFAALLGKMLPRNVSVDGNVTLMTLEKIVGMSWDPELVADARRRASLS